MTTKEQLIEYLQKNHTFGAPVDPAAEFFEAGILDSTGIIDLVLFVDTRLGVKIPNDDLTPEKIGSVDRMAAYIESKRA